MVLMHRVVLALFGLQLAFASQCAGAADVGVQGDLETAYTALVRQGKSLSARRLAEEALAQPHSGDARSALPAHLVLSRNYWGGEKRDQARQHACAAAKLINEGRSAAASNSALSYVETICTWASDSQMSDVIAKAFKAIDVAKAQGRAEDSIRAHMLAAHVSMASGKWALAEHHLTLADKTSGVEDGNFWRLRASLDRAFAVSAMSRRDEAASIARQVASVADRVGDLDALAASQTLMPQLAPNTEAGVQLYLQYIPTAERLEDPRELVIALSNLSDLQMRAGTPAEALKSAARALALLETLPDSKDLYSLVWFNKGWALNRLGRQEEGLALIAQAAADERRPSPAVAAEFAYAGRYREAYEHLLKFNSQMADTSRVATGVERVVNDYAVEHLARVEAEQRLAQVQQRQTQFAVVGVALLAAVAAIGLAMRQRLIGRHAKRLAGMNKQLEALAQTDALTGLHNRHHFMAQIGQHVAAADRSHSDAGQGQPAIDLTFFLIDLDHFKRVNDELGHAAGDEVLKIAAVRLASLIRSEDELVRWGGEEFLIMTRGHGRGGASALAERIRSAVSDAPFELPGGPRHVTCSVGFASYPIRPAAIGRPDWQGVMELADQCLYRVKRHARNGWAGVTASLTPLAGQNPQAVETGIEQGTLQVAQSWGTTTAAVGRTSPTEVA